MQEHLYKHFESEHHSGFREDVSVILIDKTDGSNPTKRETLDTRPGNYSTLWSGC